MRQLIEFLLGALFVMALTSIGGVVIALWFGDLHTAKLLLGAAIGSGATTIVAAKFRLRADV